MAHLLMFRDVGRYEESRDFKLVHLHNINNTCIKES